MRQSPLNHISKQELLSKIVADVPMPQVIDRYQQVTVSTDFNQRGQAKKEESSKKDHLDVDNNSNQTETKISTDLQHMLEGMLKNLKNQILLQMDTKFMKINSEMSALSNRMTTLQTTVKALNTNITKKVEAPKDRQQELRETQQNIMKEVIIKAAKVENWTVLTSLTQLLLGKIGLTKLPEDLFGLIQLKKLNLSQNKIGIISANIGNLINLQQLFLDSCGLDQLPSTMQKLNKISRLYLAGNNFTQIPRCILGMKKLFFLKIQNNSITRLPSGLFSLPLQELELSNNKLTDIPYQIVKLEFLKSLALDGNEFKIIPTVLAKIPRLDDLQMSKKSLRESKESIAQFQNACKEKGIRLRWFI